MDSADIHRADENVFEDQTTVSPITNDQQVEANGLAKPFGSLTTNAPVRQTVIQTIGNVGISPRRSEQAVDNVPKTPNKIDTASAGKLRSNLMRTCKKSAAAGGKRKKVTATGNPDKRQKLTNGAVRDIHNSDNAKPYGCEYCAKRFAQRKNLVQHLKIHRRQSIAFHCAKCSRGFSREAWNAHKNQCKRGLRQYECFLCKKIVINKSHLVKHMRAHTGETYRCLKCPKQFVSQLGLTHHMKQHTESFAIQCSTCRQGFSNRSQWKSHENRCKRKQYKCHICDRIVANKYHLNYHMQFHHDKIFNCPNCAKQFRSAVGFKCHKCGGTTQNAKFN